MTTELFEQAVRAKVRFDTSKGLLAAEDLYDLPLTSKNGASLDSIARQLYKQLKDANDESISFVKPSSVDTTALQLKFDVVKRVIDVRMAERDLASAAAEKAATKQKLMDVIARKKDAELENASLDDLQAMLASL